MKGLSQESLEIRYGTDSSAQLILEVAKAASSHLELAEVLESLRIAALKPTIRFDAISVFVIEGEYARLHSFDRERPEIASNRIVGLRRRSKFEDFRPTIQVAAWPPSAISPSSISCALESVHSGLKAFLARTFHG